MNAFAVHLDHIRLEPELPFLVPQARSQKNTQKRQKKANAAARKLKTIAGRLVRDVERKLDDLDRLSIYDERLWLYLLVLGQRRDDKNKIYSFHAPEVKCISKGKEHKKYEFGNKSSFVLTKNGGIVIGAMAFEDNVYDGHGIEPQLAQVEDLLGKLPETLLVDKGYKGRSPDAYKLPQRRRR